MKASYLQQWIQTLCLKWFPECRVSLKISFISCFWSCTCSSHCAVATGGNSIAGFASVPAKSCLPDSLLVCPSSTNSLQKCAIHVYSCLCGYKMYVLNKLSSYLTKIYSPLTGFHFASYLESLLPTYLATTALLCPFWMGLHLSAVS